MKTANLLLAALLITLSVTGAEGKLNVVASIPDLADIAREIGGQHVSVESLMQGHEDPHNVVVRPSHVAKLKKADVLIEMGLDFEHAFLPSLVDAAHNPHIKNKGRVVVSTGIVPKDVPILVSRKEGEQHLEGNPHFNLDPAAGRVIAKNVCDGLIANDPKNKASFEQNLKSFVEKIDAKENEWRGAAEKLKGVKFVSYHADWIYFAEYFGMQCVGTLERKPGIPPSGSHIKDLIERMNSDSVKIVVREPQFSDKLPNEVAAKTGAKVLKLAVMVGGTPEAKSWIELIDSNVKSFLQAVGK